MTDQSNGNKTSRQTLKEALQAALPQGSHFRVRHVQSRPKQCEPLFSPLPNSTPEKTRLVSHFLTVSIKSAAGTTTTDNDVLVFALEALVYTTARLATIFVSKADSTGYLPHSRPSPIKLISTTFLSWLADRVIERRPSRKLIVSIFGRAQGQYLFPGSAENTGKHVLDDRQLIKWWVRVLDPVIGARVGASARKGYITVPGYHGSELRQFLPPERQHWSYGNPLQDTAQTRGLPEHAPIRCLLPRFPDDPKARFMLDLDDEVGLSEDAGALATKSPSKRKDGRWKSVKSLEQFWEMMEFRQECSSGRVVGFLWAVFEHQGSSDDQNIAQSQMDESSQTIQSSSPCPQGLTSSKKTPSKRKTLSGPIIPRIPRIKGGSSTKQVSAATESVCLSNEGYDQAMQTLLHLDFADLDVATRSTTKWVKEISLLCRLSASQWVLEVQGQDTMIAIADKGQAGSVVNDLGSLVKKKKRSQPGTEAVESAEAAAELGTVNMLGAGLIRKKPKPSE